MKEVVKFLNDNQYGFLATVDNGRPRARPFGFMFEEDGKLYFCTNNQKDVYKQLTACPLIEYSVTSKDMVTLRITGKVEFDEDRGKKEKALEASPLVRQIYKSPDNPIFKVFFLEHGACTFADFSGNPPRRMEF